MWNPTEGYYPQDSLSTELLKSIPKKVFVWLENLGVDLTEPGQDGWLRWTFDEANNNGTIIYYDPIIDDLTQIWFDGSALDPTAICGSDERFTDIQSNLTFFAEVERKIYAELELMQEEYDRLQAFEFPKPDPR